jgi:PAS domain S-box-containing protein
MNDEDKTKEELVNELVGMRQRIAEMEALLVTLRQRDEAGQEAETTCKAMVEAFDGLIYVCSANYEVEFMNERFIQRSGCNRLGEKCYRALHDRDEICPWCVNEKVQRGETVRWEIQSPKDGRWYYVVNAPVHHSDGTISKMAMIQDVTERKKAEEALCESQERLELAMEAADLGMWDWNIQTGALAFNRRWAEMLGYSPDEIKPHIDAWEDSIYPEDAERVKDVLNRHVAGETPCYEMEYRIASKSGDVRWVLARGKVVQRDEDGRPLRATGTRLDITDRKRAEKLLRERTEALERSNGDLEQFAYLAAHDLREPLVAVGAYLKLLERSCADNLGADAHKFLSRAIETTLRMDSVIQSLLAYSRIGMDDHSLEPTDCEAILKNALSNLHSAIKESDATVTSDSLPTVMADAPQMLQLFQNLLSNAIKFRGAKPLEIHVGCNRREGESEFFVKDNGIGIEPPHFERIFRIFQRLPTGEGRPGTGIGLANCRKIVERHGGRIWVESELGAGSTFFFTLPQRPDNS